MHASYRMAANHIGVWVPFSTRDQALKSVSEPYKNDSFPCFVWEGRHPQLSSPHIAQTHYITMYIPASSFLQFGSAPDTQLNVHKHHTGNETILYNISIITTEYACMQKNYYNIMYTKGRLVWSGPKQHMKHPHFLQGRYQLCRLGSPETWRERERMKIRDLKN